MKLYTSYVIWAGVWANSQQRRFFGSNLQKCHIYSSLPKASVYRFLSFDIDDFLLYQIFDLKILQEMFVACEWSSTTLSEYLIHIDFPPFSNPYIRFILNIYLKSCLRHFANALFSELNWSAKFLNGYKFLTWQEPCISSTSLQHPVLQIVGWLWEYS